MKAAKAPTSRDPGTSTKAERTRIVLLYAIFATFWILLSDWGVEWLLNDPISSLLAGTLKGAFFVAVTSWLLYLLLQRLAAATPAAKPFKAPPILPLALLSLAILALTAGGVHYVFQAQKTKEIARLQTIADLKTRQIADWLKERRSDAHFVQTSQFFAENYRHWRDEGDAAARDLLEMRLEQFARFRGFASVLLLNAQGAPLWSSTQPPQEISPSLQEAARESASAGQVKRVGPYRDRQGRLHLEFIAPLAAMGNQAPLVVLDVDPKDWLFQSLSTWPVPTTSGETLLFRRDGDQVLFLNDLRHHPDSAAKLRLSLEAPRLLAAQVLRGQVPRGGVLEGEDYRGVPVLGVAQPIPNSDWYLIAKMDQEELLAEAGRQGVWVGLAGLLALFMAVAGLHLSRQHQELILAANVQQSQAERLRALQLLDAVAGSSTDAIYAKDLEGRYILFNQAAGAMVGKPAVEVLGHDDRAILPADQAEMLMAQDRRVLAENSVITQEEVLDTANGKRVFLATKAPLRDEKGLVIGSFGISRDITERKQAEAELQRWAKVFQQANFGLAIADAGNNTFLAVNPTYARERGYRPEELVGRPLIMVYPPDLVEEVIHKIREVDVSSHGIFESEHLCRDGRRFPVLMDITCIKSAEGRPLTRVAYTLDISERKRAEQALRESEARWIMAIDGAGHGVWDWDLRTDKVYYSPRWKTMLGYAEEEIGEDLIDWANLVHPDDLAGCLDELERHIRGETPTYISEYRLRGKDGRYKWILDQGRVVGRDVDGKPLRAIGTHTDVTRRREIDEQLRENEQRFRTLFESALVSIIIHDPETGAIIDANRQAIESYGFDTLTALQRNHFWMEPPYSFAEALQLIRKAAREGPQRFEWMNRDLHGRLFWEDVLLNRVTLNGIDQVLSISIDITARKAAEAALYRQAEELRERNQELERFNRATIGRELDMIALKGEINGLYRQLGWTPPYNLAFLQTQDETGSGGGA